MLNMGMNGYTVVALNALYGTPVTLGNVVLTVYLAAMAVGVLAGGWLTTQARRGRGDLLPRRHAACGAARGRGFRHGDADQR